MKDVHLEAVALGDAAKLLPGEILCRHTADVFGSRITVTYAVNAEEHARRNQVGTAAIEDERALAMLLALPTDDLAPVPPRFVDVAIDLASHSASTVDIFADPDGDVWARRRVDVPVRVVEIEIASSRWPLAMRAAHRWNGYGPRRIVMARGVPDELAASIEASHYGIGLTIDDGSGARVIIDADTFSPRRFTAARWLFAETVYRQFVDAVRR